MLIAAKTKICYFYIFIKKKHYVIEIIYSSY